MIESLAIVVGISVALVLSYRFGQIKAHAEVRAEAIERNLGLWHPKTREFIWRCDFSDTLEDDDAT